MAIAVLAAKFSIAASGTVQTSPDALPNTPGTCKLDDPNRLVVAVWSRDNATTFTINISRDGSLWVPATLRGTGTKFSYTAAAGGDGIAVEITPAKWVQVVSAQACTMDAWFNVLN